MFWKFEITEEGRCVHSSSSIFWLFALFFFCHSKMNFLCDLFRVCVSFFLVRSLFCLMCDSWQETWWFSLVWSFDRTVCRLFLVWFWIVDDGFLSELMMMFAANTIFICFAFIQFHWLLFVRYVWWNGFQCCCCCVFSPSSSGNWLHSTVLLVIPSFKKHFNSLSMTRLIPVIRMESCRFEDWFHDVVN